MFAILNGIADREAQRQFVLEHQRIVEWIVGLEVGPDDGDGPTTAREVKCQVESALRPSRLDDDIGAKAATRIRNRGLRLVWRDRVGAETCGEHPAFRDTV